MRLTMRAETRQPRDCIASADSETLCGASLAGAVMSTKWACSDRMSAVVSAARVLKPSIRADIWPRNSVSSLRNSVPVKREMVFCTRPRPMPMRMPRRPAPPLPPVSQWKAAESSAS